MMRFSIMASAALHLSGLSGPVKVEAPDPPRAKVDALIVNDLPGAWSWMTSRGAESITCPDPAAADALWRIGDPRPMVAVVCDGRDWVVRKALADRASRTGASAPERLFSRKSLQQLIAAWSSAAAGVQRLGELDARGGTSRVLVVRAEDARDAKTLTRVGEHLACTAELAPPPQAAEIADLDGPLWTRWLTEDDKAEFRKTAGSVLVELGYVGKSGW
jgi:hypothetical protein